MWRNHALLGPSGKRWSMLSRPTLVLISIFHMWRIEYDRIAKAVSLGLISFNWIRRNSRQVFLPWISYRNRISLWNQELFLTLTYLEIHRWAHLGFSLIQHWDLVRPAKPCPLRWAHSRFFDSVVHLNVIFVDGLCLLCLLQYVWGLFVFGVMRCGLLS